MNEPNATDDDLVRSIFTLGELIWTKVGKHPFWPCMVTYDPGDTCFIKLVKSKVNGRQPAYHVQYFGQSVQHGWTNHECSFRFKGEKDYFEKVEEFVSLAYVSGPKALKKLKTKYEIPAASKKKWLFAVKEAEEAMKIEDPNERFENYVFNYEKVKKKRSVSNGETVSRERSDSNGDKVKRKNSLSDGSADNSNGSNDTFDKSAHSSKRIRFSNDSSEVCDVCDTNNADIPCTGNCSKFFHMGCLGITKVPENFKCPKCSTDVSSEPPSMYSCFACKKSYGILIECGKCVRFYHLECLEQYECANKVKRICPLHTCATCYKENPRNIMAHKGSMVRCIQCPTAFHSRETCIAAGSVEKSLSTILCPYHFVGKQRVSPLKPCNLNTCSVCNSGGELVCCEACPHAFHKSCLKTAVSNEDFLCEDCTNKRYLLYGMVVWAKMGHYRWWPAQIKHLSYLPENVKKLSHHDGEFAVQFFGTHDYSWTHSGRVFQYVEDHKKITASKSEKLYKQFQTGLLEAAIAFDEYQKNRVSESMIDRKPEAYKHIQVNRALPPAQIMIDLSNISTCSCDPSEENPCGPDSQCLNYSMLMECHPDTCLAKELCQNQKFQKRQYVQTKLFKTNDRGWGLKTLQDVKKGEFIIEYVGEVITHEEYRKRSGQMLANGNSNYYFLYLDAKRMIDAGPMGNYSRFINHSCDPNCEMRKWSVNGDARIGIFAITDISAGEELTFNYQSDKYEFEQKCCCSSEKCRGFIGRTSTGSAQKMSSKALQAIPSKSCEVFTYKLPPAMSAMIPPAKAYGARKKKNKTTLKSKTDSEIESSDSPSTKSFSSSTCDAPSPTPEVRACSRIGSNISAEMKKRFAKLESTCSVCRTIKPEYMVMCGQKGCNKCYHLGCLGLPELPPKYWSCARHACYFCNQEPDHWCINCPVAYCNKCIRLYPKPDPFDCKSTECPLCGSRCHRIPMDSYRPFSYFSSTSQAPPP